MTRINGETYTFSSSMYYEDQIGDRTRVLLIDHAIRDFVANTGVDYVTVLFDERYSHESIYEIQTKVIDNIDVMITYRTVPNIQEEMPIPGNYVMLYNFGVIM